MVLRGEEGEPEQETEEQPSDEQTTEEQTVDTESTEADESNKADLSAKLMDLHYFKMRGYKHHA